ncbi:DNA-binding response regulator [Streptomyces sp. WZ.A104]|uniref:response regulator transcription factor n=1 Tax=Streptomyces sp. WZ.A104 TaxID=2023771 RepID=UPI000BBC9EC7|nr:response regulator transcription factor [Streptomyces sp. WZ.A104]PCG87075.1 DNA-binding response regulator [Streptomyces sp. WZ.A104]
MTHVLLIEDDPALSTGLEMALRRMGHGVAVCATGEEGLRRVEAGGIEAVVLDLMLPGMDGFEVCRRLRATGPVPLLMLTARGDDIDVVAGLEAGADDYVVKPVQPRVLAARISAVLRRSDPVSGRQREQHGDMVIDRASLTVTRGGEEVALPPTELRLLLTLSAEPARVFSREQLLEAVWEYERVAEPRLVDAAVQRLRLKIEDVPGDPRYVRTVRGFGYRFGPL